MSEWERKKFWMWAVTLGLWAVTLGIAIYFALDYRRGKDAALVKMDKGIENSTKLVAIGEQGIERIDRLEISLQTFTERIEWRLTHPFDALLGRQPSKEAGR